MHLMEFIIKKYPSSDVWLKEIVMLKELGGKDIHNSSIFHYLIYCARYCSKVMRSDLYEWGISLKEEYKEMYKN